MENVARPALATKCNVAMGAAPSKVHPASIPVYFFVVCFFNPYHAYGVQGFCITKQCGHKTSATDVKKRDIQCTKHNLFDFCCLVSESYMFV